TPMLCSYFLTVRHAKRPCPGVYRGLIGPVYTAASRVVWLVDRWVLEPLLLTQVNWLMARLTRGYAWALRHSLRHQWWVVPASVLLAASALLFVYGVNIRLPRFVAGLVGKDRLTVTAVGRELVPSEDQSRFVVNVICPVGSNIDYIDEMLQKCETIMG